MIQMVPLPRELNIICFMFMSSTKIGYRFTSWSSLIIQMPFPSPKCLIMKYGNHKSLIISRKILSVENQITFISLKIKTRYTSFWWHNNLKLIAKGKSLNETITQTTLSFPKFLVIKQSSLQMPTIQSQSRRNQLLQPTPFRAQVEEASCLTSQSLARSNSWLYVQILASKFMIYWSISFLMISARTNSCTWIHRSHSLMLKGLKELSPPIKRSLQVNLSLIIRIFLSISFQLCQMKKL